MTLRSRTAARLAVVAGALLFAGPAADAGAALLYDITLGAGVQLNDNLHLDPRAPTSAESGTAAQRPPVNETIYTLNPGVLVSWGAEHDRLRLSYGGAYSLYRGDEDRDSAWAHNLAVDLGWRRWSPLFLEAKEKRSRIPRAKELEGEAFVDQVDRNLFSVRSGLGFELRPRYTLELAYHGEFDSYSVSGGPDGGKAETVSGGEETTPAAEEFNSVNRHHAEALVSHRWSPLWAGEARLLYGRVERELATDYADLRASMTVDQRWSESLTLRYRLEWIREDDVETAGSDTAGGDPASEAASEAATDAVRSHVLVGVSMRGELERGGSWILAYQDGLADQSDGDTLETGRVSAAVSFRARLGSRLDLAGWRETRDYQQSNREETAWGPTVGARWMIAPWAALDLGAGWTSTTIREEGQQEIGDTTSRVAADVVLLMFRRLQFDLGYGFRKNDSSDALRSYTNNVVFVMLTFHFRPVESGRLPDSSAWRVVAGGLPSGGVAQAAQEPAPGDAAR